LTGLSPTVREAAAALPAALGSIDGRPQRFATIEAAEGGGGSSVDVLDVLLMCWISPCFPHKSTVGIVQRQKSRFSSDNPLTKNQELELRFHGNPMMRNRKVSPHSACPKQISKEGGTEGTRAETF